MIEKTFDFIQNEEDSHWWFRGRFDILLELFRRNIGIDIENLVDLGCGTGKFIDKVSHLCENAYGVEEYGYKDIGNDNIIKGSALKTTFEDKSMDVVTALDVLEHIENEDDLILEAKRLLKDSGTVLFTVPAFQSLYSRHDKEHGHFRRYNKKQLIQVFERNGFSVEKCSYFNTYLFPIAGTIRLFEKIFNIGAKADEKPIEWINNILYKVFSAESGRIIKKDFAYGLSLVIIAKKACGGEASEGE